MSESQIGMGTGVAVWRAPPLGGGERAAGVDDVEVERQREAALEASRDHGYRLGFARGREEAMDGLTRQAARLADLADALVPRARLLDDQVLEQLASVVAVAVRQFVRRELSLQPGEVVRVIREAVAVLPIADATLRLRLHPEDAALVVETLLPQQLDRPWRIVEDLTVARGGVLVQTETSIVDATVEARMNALLARLLGDERRNLADAEREPADE
jgi:flagellar assembly protein FliH